MPKLLVSVTRRLVLAVALLIAGAFDGGAYAQTDPLSSWNDGPAKKSIVDFVTRVSKEGGPYFIAVPERIATFDNDGTLWTEQPYYFQRAFAIDRIKAMAPQHPEWKSRQPFKALLEGDKKALAAAGKDGLLQIVAVTHAGVTVNDFSQTVVDWTKTARHPRFNRPYTEPVFQPMQEFLAYLRANGFKTFIVSGCGVEFMRPWTERVYRISPEQVVGSSGEVKFQIGADGNPPRHQTGAHWPKLSSEISRVASECTIARSASRSNAGSAAVPAAIGPRCSVAGDVA